MKSVLLVMSLFVTTACSVELGVGDDEAEVKEQQKRFTADQLNSPLQQGCENSGYMYDGASSDCINLPLIKPCDVEVLKGRYAQLNAPEMTQIENRLTEGFVIHSCGGNEMHFGVSMYREEKGQSSFGVRWQTVVSQPQMN